MISVWPSPSLIYFFNPLLSLFHQALDNENARLRPDRGYCPTEDIDNVAIVQTTLSSLEATRGVLGRGSEDVGFT